MPLIEWEEAFLTGIASLDHEHREMIDLLNTMAATVLPDGPGERVTAFLGEVYVRIAAHFALEERIMQAHRYAGYAEHKADHERLLDDLRDLMERHEAEGAGDVRDELAGRLRDWFMVHFHRQDAQLHQLLG